MFARFATEAIFWVRGGPSAFANAFGTLLRVLVVFSLIDGCNGVDFCKYCLSTTCPGCEKPDECPLVAGVNANRDVFENGKLGSYPVLSPTFSPEMASVFTRSVCEAIIGKHTAPPPGRSVDLSDDAYKSAGSIGYG